MRIAIIAKSGPATGRRIVLRGGQIARVGRTDWADFALPEDLELADIHFGVQCNSDAAKIQALALDRETKVNGTPITEAEIKHGDAIEAGATLFHVEIEGATRVESENQGSVASPNAEPKRNESLEFATYIGLSEPALELARGSPDPIGFGDLLIRNSMLQDALSWYAHSIPKPAAVHCGCACVEELMRNASNSIQFAAFRAAARWGREPNDENREDAKQLAEIAKHEGMGGILAAAAGWSGGSLGPNDSPVIPPDDRLTARCICIALTIADSLEGVAGTSVRLIGFIERFRRVHTDVSSS